jgi:hypothetical protein
MLIGVLDVLTAQAPFLRLTTTGFRRSLVAINLSDLSVADLKRFVGIKEQIEGLETQLNALIGGEAAPEPAKPGRRTMSAAARRKIAAAQRARWARVKGTDAAPDPKKRRMRAVTREFDRLFDEGSNLIDKHIDWSKIKVNNPQSKRPPKDAKPKKRRMSAAGRAAISAAAKARWARARAARLKPFVVASFRT